MKVLVCATIMLAFLICVLSAKGEDTFTNTTFLTLQPMRDGALEVRDIIDLDTLKTIKIGHVEIYTPKGRSIDVTSDIWNLFTKAYKRNGRAHTDIFAPPKTGFWAFCDAKGKPVFLLTRYVVGVFSVCGLHEAGEDIYQCVSNSLWNGSFNSIELDMELQRLCYWGDYFLVESNSTAGASGTLIKE